MHVIAALAVLALLVVVLMPFASARIRAARKGRAVHLNGSCHWYANYDEDLRYEPKRRSDIVRLTRADVIDRDYKPTLESHVVPRTFRHRVPGDKRVRLWRSDRHGAPPLWLCEWAEHPVRVSIGAGEREKVPGVESMPLPLESWGEAHDEEEATPEAASDAWSPAAPDRVTDAIPAELDVAAGWPEFETESVTAPEPADPTTGETRGDPGTAGERGAAGKGNRRRRRRRK